MKSLRYASLAVLGLSTMLAHADDFAPPPWRLGNASATVQEWDFTTPNVNLAPDGATWGSGGGGYVNANGVPTFDNSNGTWFPNQFGRNGVWEIGGNQGMGFTIPNDGPDQTETKDVYIQLTSFAAGTTLVPDVFIGSPAYTGPATLVSSVMLTDGWTHSVWDTKMPWCPAFERILINNTTPVVMDVDQVVVDTICNPTPEPMSMLAMGAGFAGLIARRRKKARA